MKINLVKLTDDINRLKFRIKPGDLGFEESDQTSLLFPNDIEANIEVQKFSDKYFIKVNLNTLVHYCCDRCLVDFDQPLNTAFQLIYSKYSSDQFEDDEFRFLGETEAEIDLGSDIRENILLVLPMKHLCKETCRGLCPHCGTNLNYETCDCQQATIDPRWEKLKSLQSNN